MIKGGNDGSGSRKSAGKPLIAFTGGGTGGHIYPGLAVIQALREKGFAGRIVWIGSQKPLDRSIVEKEGIEYFAIPSGKLRRSITPKNLADAFRVMAGFIAARRLLTSLQPDLLFSKGGYVSVPPCRAAASLGIPYYTHESDTSPGLATRLNAGKAKRILLSWPRTASMLSASLQARVEVVGNPVRLSLFRGDAARGRTLLGAPAALPVIFIAGGSQGSRQVNGIVQAIRPSFAGKAFIVHQTGKELFDPALNAEKPGSYIALPYIGDEMSDILAATTLVAGRAGAGTVWESAALGKPMVLIPLTGSGTRGDQVENAQMAEMAGAAVCLIGDKATPASVLAALSRYLDDAAALEKAKHAGMSLCRITKADGEPRLSADYIADMILRDVGQAPGGKQ